MATAINKYNRSKPIRSKHIGNLRKRKKKNNDKNNKLHVLN
jgi:hypothetical protein